MQQIVQPYVVAGTDPQQPELVALVDEATGAHMRAILHHPQFQTVEAAWRAVYFLVRRLETELGVRLFDRIGRSVVVTDAVGCAADLVRNGENGLVVPAGSAAALTAALRCVVTFTEELALKQAEQADKEIAAKNYRGPLLGIPWGAKDLIAYPGYKTTWGAAPFKEQVIDTKATVARRLEEAASGLARCTRRSCATGRAAARSAAWRSSQ